MKNAGQPARDPCRVDARLSARARRFPAHGQTGQEVMNPECNSDVPSPESPTHIEDASTVDLLGVHFHNVTLEEFLTHVDRIVAGRTPSYVVTPNIDHVVRLESDVEFQRAYAHAALVVCDSKPLMWAARLLGVTFRQKLSGSDLVHWLSRHASQHNYRLFLLGAAPGVTEKARDILASTYPGLSVVGCHSPPVGFERDNRETARIEALLAECRPDICFVALGSPKQEKWMASHVDSCGVPLMLGIGAGLDFVAGRFKRAPHWVQACGMEWLWRLCSDPRRLFKRYAIDDSHFFAMVFREWTRGRRMRRASAE